MSYEVLDKDLAGRIGRLKTRRGTIETPYLFPVINPFDPTISVKDIKELGFNAFITNVLHVRRAIQELGVGEVHELLGFQGPVMTDSGAYQLLVYGQIDITPEEAIRLQEKCGSDIAVILDYPTGMTSYDEARFRVNETIRRAEALESMRVDETMLWVGPIQGAPYMDLVQDCAKKLSNLNFDIYAIGSPTIIMESYNYDFLTEVVYTVKRILPLEKPLHLFGAGHPMMLPLVVALGCDLFDSASYILYAKDFRYMTPSGTYKLQDLSFFPCSCPVCSKYTPQELSELASQEKVKLLALHNLHVTISELRKIKQSIREGTLWELVSSRSRMHPRLFSAFLKFKKYKNFIEVLDPVTKPSICGLFYYDHHDLYAPKVVRHLKRLKMCVEELQNKILILLPRRSDKAPITFIKEMYKELRNRFKDLEIVRFLFYDFPYSLIPLELEGVYPVSQYESPTSIDALSKLHTSLRVQRLLRLFKPKAIILYNDVVRWGNHIERACRKACSKVRVLHSKDPYTTNDLEKLFSALRDLLKD